MSDHKAEAEGRLDILNGNDYTGADSEAAVAAAMAQVSATLYLAEQQRIANLLTFAGMYTEQSECEAVGAQMRKALGL